MPTYPAWRGAPLATAALLAVHGLSGAHAQTPAAPAQAHGAQQHHHHSEDGHYNLAQQTLDAVTAEGSQAPEYLPKAAPSVSGPMPLTLRETPRSVAVITEERMQDEALVSTRDVLARTTGVTFSFHNTQEGVHAVSRGFRLDNILIDGLSLQGSQRKMPGDLALYEQVEIMRGPAGLYAGSGAAGNTGGAINLVRKKPTREKRASVQLAGGSWSNYRAMVDASGALNASGSVRARAIVSYIDREFFYDFAYHKNLTAGGSVEMDLTPATLLTVGLDYEKREARAAAPRYFRAWDGSDPGPARRASSTGMPWGQSAWNEYGAFLQLDHRFANDWHLKAHYVRKKWDSFDDYAAVTYQANNRAETLEHFIQSSFGKGKFQDQGFIVNLHGAFDLFGRAHDFVTGFSWQNNKYRALNFPSARRGYGNSGTFSRLEIVDFPTMDYSRYPYLPSNPDWSQWNVYEPDRQSGYYANVRWHLSNPLKITTGFRASRYSDGGISRDYTRPPQYKEGAYKESNEVTPFAAISYDLHAQHTVHASYSEVFAIQNRYDIAGRRVDPLKGENWELSLKSDWNGGRLHSAFTLFRLERTNETRQVQASPCEPLLSLHGITAACYVADNKQRASGVEMELSGSIAANWDISMGLSAIKRKYAHWTDADGNALQGQSFNDYEPTRTMNVWLLHRLQGAARGWRAGLGMRAQNKIWRDIDAAGTRPAFTIRQGGYAVFNAMASWEMTPQWRAQLNVNNLANRNYQSGYLSAWYVYNAEPRSYMLTLMGRF